MIDPEKIPPAPPRPLPPQPLPKKKTSFVSKILLYLRFRGVGGGSIGPIGRTGGGITFEIFGPKKKKEKKNNN